MGTSNSAVHSVGVAAVLPGDMNADGVLDAADVSPFVELLVGAEAIAVPEPSGALWFVVAGWVAWRRRR